MHVKRQQQQQVFAAVTGLAGIKYISIHSCLSSTEKHSHPRMNENPETCMQTNFRHFILREK